MATKRTTTSTRGTSVKAQGKGKEDLDAVLAAIDDALHAYAPTRRAALAGARDLAAIEALAAVPADLRALWARFDGAAELIYLDASEIEEGGIDLFSVTKAVSELAMLREVAQLDRGLVPFAGDGAGNVLVVDQEGRVLDWDHETRALTPVAPSLAALLGRTQKAIAKKTLFGGPEKKPGAVDPKLKRAETLLKKPVENFDRLLDAVAMLEHADAFRILTTLRASLPALPAHAQQSFGTSYLMAAAQLAEWDAAFEGAGLAPQGSIHDWWAFVGEKALLAGAPDRAAEAFAKGSSVRAKVGAAVAAWKRGAGAGPLVEEAAREVKAEKDRMEKKLADDAAKGAKRESPDALRYLDALLLHEATLARVRGDEAEVEAKTAEAEKRCGKNVAFEVDLAKAAGIGWRERG